MASAANTIQHLTELLADALQQVERDFSSTTRSWNHAGNDVAFDAAQVLGSSKPGRWSTCEVMRPKTPRRWRYCGSSTTCAASPASPRTFARLPHPVSGVAQALIDHLAA
jgi:hypothetical protein